MAAVREIKDDADVKSSFAKYREGQAAPDIRLTIYLVLTARRWRSLLDDRLRPIEQSSARMEALSAILNSPPLRPQVDIAKRLRIEGPTLTRMLDALEKDNLVERLPDPADRRTKQLKVTPEGEQVLEQICEIADELRDRLLRGYSEEKLMEMGQFFEELLARLDAGLPDE